MIRDSDDKTGKECDILCKVFSAGPGRTIQQAFPVYQLPFLTLPMFQTDDR